MPLYDYGCKCGNRIELIQAIGIPSPACSMCGGSMAKVISAPALVKVAGIYPNPSARKWHDGTAPFTSGGGHQEIWQEGNPNEPIAEKQGRKWLSDGRYRGIKRDPEAVYGRSLRKRGGLVAPKTKMI